MQCWGRRADNKSSANYPAADWPWSTTTTARIRASPTRRWDISSSCRWDSAVFGIDPVNRRVLWDKDLLQEVSGPLRADTTGQPMWNQQVPLVPIHATARYWCPTPTTGAQRIGQVSPFEGQTICVQTPKTLSAIDPLNGRVLWSRHGHQSAQLPLHR